MDKYKIDVPEGSNGAWRIERFTVTEENEQFGILRAMATGRGRYAPAGNYTRLMRNGTLVMSDTPDEIGDHMAAISMAKGEVLVNGLGLGICVAAMLEKPEVEHVTVVEIAPEVIGLVGPWLKQGYDEQVDFVLADALTWKAPTNKRYDVVWHDIWDSICTDNLEEMKTLHRKYGRRCNWQGSWCRARVELLRERGW